MMPSIPLERCERHERGEPAMSSGRAKKGLSKIPTPLVSPRGPPSPRAPPVEAHDWADTVRTALRQELVAFFGERGDLSKAFVLHGEGLQRAMSPMSPQVLDDRPSTGPVATQVLDDDGSECSGRNAVADHLGKFTIGKSTLVEGGAFGDPRNPGRTMSKTLVTGAKSWWHTTEQKRTGWLADVVSSRYFERTIQILILLHCLVMGIAADHRISHAAKTTSDDAFESTMTVCDIVFQLAYTVELVMKLLVHRWFFFWNEEASYNVFDMLLVVSGYADLLFDSGSGSVALRLIRILRLAKALRALKVIAAFDTLRAILICVQGSFKTLGWSMLMLYIVFYIFSLIILQQVAARIEDIGDREDDGAVELLGLFSSVTQSILTLTKAAFGGEDWGVSYDIIVQCGWISSVIYMLFVAFTQIALINIITGIFVDNAMQSLSPNREQMAIKLEEEEQGFADELKKLCIAVDADHSGFLTKEQFEDGIDKGRIPLLLHLLGLDQDHVQNFFDVLCASSDDNQVDIESFVRGCMRLKGPATSFDVQILLSNVDKLERHHAREFRNLKRRMDRAERSATAGPGRPPRSSLCSDSIDPV